MMKRYPNHIWIQAALMPIVLTLTACAGPVDSAATKPSQTRPAVLADQPDSYVDEHGRIVDNVDRPFVDDPALVGTWKSVDFVSKPDEFKVGHKHWKGDLFFKEITLLPQGRCPQTWWRWTKGYIMHQHDRTASRYLLRKVDGTTYMFFEWKSGDYSIRYQQPSWYVFKKAAELPDMGKNWSGYVSDQDFSKKLQKRIDSLNINTLEQIVAAFGEPLGYIWQDKTFTRDQLPQTYIMEYPSGFSVMMSAGHVGEWRFETPAYVFEGKLHVGSSQDEALKLLGPPAETVTGKKCEFKDRVLYTAMPEVHGITDNGYYARKDRHVRMFFMHGKVNALFVTSSTGPE